jgi:hypothetical protein
MDKYWIKLSRDALDYAKRKKKRIDYIRMCKTRPVTKSQNIDDSIQILEKLININVIREEEDGTLTLIDPECTFLNEDLKRGCDQAWKVITEVLPRAHRFRKFDDKFRKEVGEKGEKFVFEQLSNILDEFKIHKLAHVSKTDDTAGYDILSPTNISNEMVFLEVKTTVQPGPFNLYLSRNEFEVSQREQNKWFLVLVRIKNDTPVISGFIESNKLGDIVPIDINEKISRWESISIYAQESWINPGLPVE